MGKTQGAGKVKSEKGSDPSGMIGISSKFAALNKLITRDLNNNTNTPTFSLYSKDDITKYLSNPYTYEKQLRQAVVYMYGASPHFRRLIQYFTGLSDLAYVVSPSKIDPQSANPKVVNRNYRKVLNAMSAMNVRTQFPKILTVCFREDVFYGTLWVSNDSITIQQLPSDYCAISTIEGNVCNVSFDFSYFDSKSQMLGYYPKEFTTKYNLYQKNRMSKWIELDSPTSFAIKCNTDVLEYAMPPFAGVLREVYDLEDYKQLKMSKTALENYAMLDMRLPMDEEGRWLLDYDRAKEFWTNLDAVLPEEVGSILSPMEIKKIGFDRSNTSDTDTISEAEQNLFSAAGVSSLLFNNEKASANALVLSIKADQAITFGIVKSIEDMVNRFIQAQSYGKNFKVTFLDCSQYNRKEVGDQFLKAAQYGLPTVMMYSASQGLSQAEFDSMNFLENTVLNLKSQLIPLKGSAQMGGSDTGGAPQKDVGDITDSGEQSREQGDDWG
jgi:hypothetical protein